MKNLHQNVPFKTRKQILYFTLLWFFLSLFWGLVSFIIIHRIISLSNHWLRETTIEILQPQIEHFLLKHNYQALQNQLQKLHEKKALEYFAVFIQSPDTSIDFSSSPTGPKDSDLLQFPLRFRQNDDSHKALISVAPRKTKLAEFTLSHLPAFLFVVFAAGFISALFIFFLYYFLGVKPLRELANTIIQFAPESSDIQLTEEADNLFAAVNMDVSQIRGAIKELSQKVKSYRRKEQSAKRKLSEREEILQRITETAADIIVIINMKGKILLVNEAALQLTGYARDEVENKKVTNFIPPEYLHEFSERIAKRSGGDYRKYLYEIEFISRSGERIPAEVSSSPILRNGKVRAILIVARDISSRKKTEKELEIYRTHLQDLIKKRTAELEEKNKELERLNDLFVGREFRIKELKEKIKILSEQIERIKNAPK